MVRRAVWGVNGVLKINSGEGEAEVGSSYICTYICTYTLYRVILGDL